MDHAEEQAAVPCCWGTRHPILISGVLVEAGAAVFLTPTEAAPLVAAGYLDALAGLPPEGAIALGVLDEVRADASAEAEAEAQYAAAEALTPPGGHVHDQMPSAAAPQANAGPAQAKPRTRRTS